ncbi:MAG TPA: cation:proton antiporter, partial [Chryseosolibacter sp.]|nr:cation:proton antiporter [Chryseosolibacter sp.]
MRKHRNLVFYVLMLAVFGALMVWITHQGQSLEGINGAGDDLMTEELTRPFTLFQETFRANLHHPLAILILQIIAIILVSRVFGFFFNRIGQPTVIGEIIAGIVLGPSVAGLLLPEFGEFLFPAASLGNLQFLSQVGLILFMFVIGMELDLKVLRHQAHD